MRHRVSFALAVLGLIGAVCGLGALLAPALGWPQGANMLRAIALPAIWAYVGGVVVRKAAQADANAAVPRVAQEWLPEVVGIEFSRDLLPEFTRSQQEILAACKTLRQEQGIDVPVVRFRDDSLLANRSYVVSINGIRISGVTLEAHDELPTQLVAVLKGIWAQYADAIRFFADVRGRTAVDAPVAVGQSV